MRIQIFHEHMPVQVSSRGRQKWWLISLEHHGVNNLNLRGERIHWRLLIV